jgi:cytochrome c biogenesis protein CcmG/thiol:disulfide interchange protein DsbE
MNVRKWLGITVLLVFGGVLVYLVAGAMAQPVQEGQPAPDFSLTRINGQTVRLSDYRGKIVLVNFFTTWCPPCQQEAPILESFQERYRGKVTVIMIDRQESPATVAAFVRKYGLTTVVVLDPGDREAKPYGITGQPETFFINPQGILVEHQIGPVDDSLLENVIRQMDTSQATARVAAGD